MFKGHGDLSDNHLSSRDFHRILLIKPSALGDVIHAVPVLTKLRERYPDAQIDWMLSPAIAEWVGHHPAINRVLEFDRKAMVEPRKAPFLFWRLMKELTTGGYDLVIDLHGQFRSAFFTLATGAPVRIGFDRPRKSSQTSVRHLPAEAYKHAWTGAREISWVAYSHHIAIPTLEAHAVDRYLWLGEMLGFSPDNPDFSVPIPQHSIARAGELLGHNGDENRRLLLISPGTIWDTKRWRVEGFAEVARHFMNQDWTVAIIGSAGDRSVCDELASLARGTLNLCGQTKISELAALTQRADLCITNDSGPMHLAVALSRPVVSIFGPTDPLWIGPYGRPNAVVQLKLPCSPCYLRSIRQCPNGHACMRDIDPQDVITRAMEILGEAWQSVPA
jgi:heptosyltransferase-1